MHEALDNFFISYLTQVQKEEEQPLDISTHFWSSIKNYSAKNVVLRIKCNLKLEKYFKYLQKKCKKSCSMEKIKYGKDFWPEF